MSSIALVTTKSVLRASLLPAFGYIIATGAMPVCLYALLRSQGLEAGDQAMTLILYRLMSVNAILCAVAATESFLFRPRQYSLPITTIRLVATQLIPASLIIATQIAVVTGAENHLFARDFPIWGPAAFAVTAAFTYTAAYWQAKGSRWQQIGPGFVGVSMGVWYGLHYVPFFQDVTGGPLLWPVSYFEFAILPVITLVSFFLTVRGISRDRCGENDISRVLFRRGDLSLDLTSSLEVTGQSLFGLFETKTGMLNAFRSARHALLWSEMVQRVWVAPALQSAVMIVAFGIWIIVSRDAGDLVKLFIEGGGLLAATGGVIGGMLFGTFKFNYGQRQEGRPFEMGPFLASLPVTNVEFANAKLKVMSRSILICWSIWAIGFAIIGLIELGLGIAPQPFFPDSVRWWYFPATLLGPWIAIAVLSSILLIGNERIPVICSAMLVATCFADIFLSEIYLSSGTKKIFHQIVLYVFDAVIIGGTAYLLVLAVRRRYLTPRFAVCQATIWLVAVSVILWEWRRNPGEPLAPYLFVTALAALAIVPFAATPLAVAQNRSR